MKDTRDRKEYRKSYYEKNTGIVHHVDHIIPLSKGGLHHQDNLQILTAEENLKKHAKILIAEN